MALQILKIPDGDYCADKNGSCPYIQNQDKGFHFCILFGKRLLDRAIVNVSGDRKRLWQKRTICRQRMYGDKGNGITPDKERPLWKSKV